jgi:hypothetical protein
MLKIVLSICLFIGVIAVSSCAQPPEPNPPKYTKQNQDQPGKDVQSRQKNQPASQPGKSQP